MPTASQSQTTFLKRKKSCMLGSFACTAEACKPTTSNAVNSKARLAGETTPRSSRALRQQPSGWIGIPDGHLNVEDVGDAEPFAAGDFRRARRVAVRRSEHRGQ